MNNKYYKILYFPIKYFLLIFIDAMSEFLFKLIITIINKDQT